MSARSFTLGNLKFINLEKILIALYAIYTCRGVFLAFESNNYLPWFAFIMKAVTYLSVIVTIVYFIKIRKVSVDSIVMAIVPMIYWFMQVYHPARSYSGGWELALLTSVLFLLLPDQTKGRIFRCFYWIVQGTNIVSLLLWIIFFAGINIGFQKLPYYAQASPNIEYHYYRWFIFAIYSEDASFRLCSIFNEPGGLGTLCALLFICTYKKSSRWEKAILLLTGICTFSLAFFLLIFGFAAVYICQKRLFNIVYMFLFIAAFLAIPNIDFHNDALNRAAARFAITDGRLAGYNRTNSVFDEQYENFIKSDDVWLGKGPGFKFIGSVGSSYKSHYIVPYGIVGTVLMLGSWVGLALYCSKRRREALLFSMFFFVSLYQRPAMILGITGYVLIAGGNIWLTQSNEVKEK